MSLEAARPRIEQALFGGNKIEAIKIYREEAGCQLVEAKNAVEAIEKELRKSRPEFFARRSAAGPDAILLLFIAMALGALAWVLLKD